MAEAVEEMCERRRAWVGELLGGRRPIIWVDYSHKKIYVIHHCLWMTLIKNGSHNNQPKIGIHKEGEYGGEMRRAGGAWEM